MFKRLFGTRESSPTQLTPLPLIGGFDVEVVGESHYQDALAQVCGGRGVESAQYDCTAVLRAEPTNPYDPNAIRIETPAAWSVTSIGTPPRRSNRPPIGWQRPAMSVRAMPLSWGAGIAVKGTPARSAFASIWASTEEAGGR